MLTEKNLLYNYFLKIKIKYIKYCQRYFFVFCNFFLPLLCKPSIDWISLKAIFKVLCSSCKSKFMVPIINFKNYYYYYCNQDAVFILFRHILFSDINRKEHWRKTKTVQLIRHSITILIFFSISVSWEIHTCVCHVSLSTICGHWGRKTINFVLSALLPLLSINYLFYLF